MDTTILENLGLSKGEIKVYLVLLELGTTKVGKIIEKSAMVSSAVHNSINSLKDKGLISYIKRGKINFYQAVPPKQLISFIDDKKKKLQQILPELELKQKLAKDRQEAEVFIGKKGIIAMLNILIENTRKGDEYLFFPVTYQEHDEEIQTFFLNYDLKRAEKKLMLKGLTHPQFKRLFIKRKIHHMKYTSMPLPTNISICKDKICFFSWGEKPVGYLIKSKQIVETFKNFFNSVWNMN